MYEIIIYVDKECNTLGSGTLKPFATGALYSDLVLEGMTLS